MSVAPSGFRQAAAFALGLLLPLAFLLAFAPPGRSALTGWDNHYLASYPWNFDALPKHLIIGTGCWTWTAEAYMPKDGGPAAQSQRAALHEMLNAVLDEQASLAGGARHERFFGFGRPFVDFERHLVSIHQAVRQDNVKSIVYINNPGSLEAFTTPPDTLRVLPVLDAVERDFPRLAPDVAVYRAALLASRGHAKALDDEAARPLARPQADLERWSKGLARRWQGIRQSVALTPFPQAAERQAEGALLAKVRANYANPKLCSIPSRGLMPPDEYFIASGGDAVWTAWLRIATGLAQERGIPFVYYVPPHLNIPAAQHAQEFKPFFVDRVRAVLRDFRGAMVIDHSIGHDLTPYDQVYDQPGGFAAGYLLNVAGKLTQSRRLLAALAEQGLVDAPPERFAAPTQFEASLPDISCSPQVLSAEDSARVREDVIRLGTWRLSRPVREAKP